MITTYILISTLCLGAALNLDHEDGLCIALGDSHKIYKQKNEILTRSRNVVRSGKFIGTYFSVLGYRWRQGRIE